MEDINIRKGQYPLVLSADEVNTVYNLLKIGHTTCQKRYSLAQDVIIKAKALNAVVQQEKRLEKAVENYRNTVNPPLPF